MPLASLALSVIDEMGIMKTSIKALVQVPESQRGKLGFQVSTPLPRSHLISAASTFPSSYRE